MNTEHFVIEWLLILLGIAVFLLGDQLVNSMTHKTATGIRAAAICKTAGAAGVVIATLAGRSLAIPVLLILLGMLLHKMFDQRRGCPIDNKCPMRRAGDAND